MAIQQNDPVPGLFSFYANAPAGSASSYPAMEARRRIALAMLSKSRGYPKNLGEGLTAIGDAIGDRAVLNQLASQESAYQKQAAEAASGMIPTEARTPSSTGPSSETEPVTPPARTSSLAPVQTPIVTASLTPEEQAAGVVGSEANALDAAAPAAATPAPAPAPVATVRGVTPNAQSWYSFAVKPLDQGGLGFSPAQAAAKVANLQAESSRNILPSGVTGDAGTAHGAAQWRNDRYFGSGNRQGLLSFARANGLDPNTTETQQKFMRYEYMGPEKAAYNRIIATQTPQDAATAINRYYERSADRSGNREAIAARLAGLFGGAGAAPPVQAAQNAQMAAQNAQMGAQNAQNAQMTPPAAPLTVADAAASDLLGDVTGMGAGDRGYAFAPTASLGRVGDVQSDAPPITGISPNVAAGAADTIQQGRDAVARARLQPTAPAPPPTAPPPPSAGVVSDITPAPPPPGAQLAQAGPAAPPRAALPPDLPMTAEEKQGWQIRARGMALGDPNVIQQGQALIDYGAAQRNQRQQLLTKDYQDRLLFERQRALEEERRAYEKPERDIRLAKGQQELQQSAIAPPTPGAPPTQLAGPGVPGGPDPRLGTPESPQRTGVPSAPPVPPGITPMQHAQQQAPLLTQAAQAVEKATPEFQRTLDEIEQIRKHPGKDWGLGLTGEVAGRLPTDAKDFLSRIEQLKGKTFLQAYKTLQGGGQISNVEGEKAQQAMARLDPRNAKGFNAALDDFEKQVRSDMEQAQRKTNRPVTAWPIRGAPGISPDIGERRGNWEFTGGAPDDPRNWRKLQ